MMKKRALLFPAHNVQADMLYLASQVWLESTGEVAFNATLPDASFSTSGLRPDHRYLVSVTAVNARGAARPHRLQFHTLKQVTEHLSEFTFVICLGKYSMHVCMQE